jgi:hypothetical protein
LPHRMLPLLQVPLISGERAPQAAGLVTVTPPVSTGRRTWRARSVPVAPDSAQPTCLLAPGLLH